MAPRIEATCWSDVNQSLAGEIPAASSGTRDGRVKFTICVLGGGRYVGKLCDQDTLATNLSPKSSREQLLLDSTHLSGSETLPFLEFIVTVLWEPGPAEKTSCMSLKTRAWSGPPASSPRVRGRRARLVQHQASVAKV